MLSNPFLCGAQILQLTADHRIDGNLFEQARVTEAGGVVSTVDKSGTQNALAAYWYHFYGLGYYF